MNSAPPADPSSDPTLAVAERQLILLGELAEIGMAAARASGASAVAAAEAEQRILAEEYFTPEVGRARACGAKDAAESLQKICRAVRLTLKLEMIVAEMVRDIHAGIVTHSHAGADARAADEIPHRNAGVLARPAAEAEARDRDHRGSDTEHLVEFDYPDILLPLSFRPTVESIGADLGVDIDWVAWKVAPPDMDYGAAPRRSPEDSDARAFVARPEAVQSP